MIHAGEQITNIAIQVSQLQQQTITAQKISETAITVAIICAIAALFAAIFSGMITWKKHTGEQQYQKQLAFIGKKSTLFDSAIDITTKLLWNKLLIAAKTEEKVKTEANLNIFLLSRDCLLIESQLLIYGGQSLADAVASFKNIILNTPSEQILSQWNEILEEGRKQLFILRQDLGLSVIEKYEDFSKKITPPPEINKADSRVSIELGSKKS